MEEEVGEGEVMDPFSFSKHFRLLRERFQRGKLAP